VPHTLKDVLPVTAGVNSEGRLEVGGLDCAALAQEFGTPLYVFCTETFRTRAREFSKAFPDSTIYYAAKALSVVALCELAEQEGLSMDVASGGELHVALESGFPPERLIMHGNNKDPREINQAVEAGIGRIAIDNLEEIDVVAASAERHGRRQPVLIRVTPGVEAHTHHYVQTGQEDSKFGVSLEAGMASQAVKRASEKDSLELRGIHAHIGSNIFSFDPYAKTIELLFEFAAEMQKTGIELREVDLGGGIGVPYVGGDYPVRLELLANLVRETADREAEKHGITPPQLSFEPGRFLVANAGLTLYRVGVIKEIPVVRKYVSVDGGMSDNIRPALYESRYAAVVANKATHEPGEVVTIAGMHCESGDVLIRDIMLPKIATGDILAVPATGAYGYAMASNYNMKPRPAMIMVADGRSQLVVRRETFDDLTRLHVRLEPS
jgi:diaminopimelate decarboxylase